MRGVSWGLIGLSQASGFALWCMGGVCTVEAQPACHFWESGNTNKTALMRLSASRCVRVHLRQTVRERDTQGTPLSLPVVLNVCTLLPLSLSLSLSLCLSVCLSSLRSADMPYPHPHRPYVPHCNKQILPFPGSTFKREKAHAGYCWRCTRRCLLPLKYSLNGKQCSFCLGSWRIFLLAEMSK